MSEDWTPKEKQALLQECQQLLKWDIPHPDWLEEIEDDLPPHQCVDQCTLVCVPETFKGLGVHRQHNHPTHLTHKPR